MTGNVMVKRSTGANEKRRILIKQEDARERREYIYYNYIHPHFIAFDKSVSDRYFFR